MERRGGIKKEREGAITAAQSQAGPGIAGCCSDGRPQERKTGKLRACGVGARGKWTSDGYSGLDLILIHYLDCWTKRNSHSNTGLYCVHALCSLQKKQLCIYLESIARIRINAISYYGQYNNSPDPVLLWTKASFIRRRGRVGTFPMEEGSSGRIVMGRVMIIIMITVGKSSKISHWEPISIKALQPLHPND